jgi:hypothetical protein
MFAALRALSPARNVRVAVAPGAPVPGLVDPTSTSTGGKHAYSPALVRAFQPGSMFPLHFDSLQAYEWDTLKGKQCGEI